MTGLDMLYSIGFIEEDILGHCLVKTPQRSKNVVLIRYAAACVIISVIGSALLTHYSHESVPNNTIGQTQSIADYGCDYIPVIQIDSRNYRYEKKLLQSSLPSDLAFVGTCAFVEHGELNSQNATVITNRQDFNAASVWISGSSPNLIFVECSGEYHLFVLDEVTYVWVCYNNSLYLHEGYYTQSNYEWEVRDSGVLEEGAVLLGTVSFDTQYSFPSKQLTTNSSYAVGLLAYAVPGQDEYILIAVPGGLSGGRTRYVKYYKTTPVSRNVEEHP